MLLALVCAKSSAGADRTSEAVVSRIPHEAVESRGLAAVGYSKRLHALEIEFHRGGTYRYLDVPAAVYRELLAAASKAHYYNDNIRGRFRAVRVRSNPSRMPNQ